MYIERSNKKVMTLKELCKKKKVKMKDVAAKLWPKSSANAQKVNMSMLSSGQRISIRPEWIEILAVELEVTSIEILQLLTQKNQ